MRAKSADLERLEGHYGKTGNQLVVLFGRKECQKEELIREFVKGKKFFYYRCRQASAPAQKQMMGQAVANQYGVKLQKHTYDEYFNRIKSGDPTKLVVVIDEAHYALKRDAELAKSIIKLRMKRLYPGPVMIILATSSTVWATQEAAKLFGEDVKRVDEFIRVENLKFLDVVRTFPRLSVSDTIRIYGVLGGVPGYLEHWNQNLSFKENVCRLVLSPQGALFGEAEATISAELRELSIYSTILSTIAQGHNKLNELFQETGFSRAKISVYMKNLSHFDIVEKVLSFETGGWENAKKGVYQIQDTFVNFWFKFVYPHLSELHMMNPEEFYDQFIAPEIDGYLNRYFRNVCMEYLGLLDQLKRLPFPIHKMGTWVGKTGNVDIIAQSTDRRNLVGLCNWEQPVMTADMCEKLEDSMEKARISAEQFYLFSATRFSAELVKISQRNSKIILIDMKEL